MTEEIVKKKLAGLNQLSDVLKGVRLLVENDPLGEDPEDMWAYLADVAKAPVPLRIYETGEAPDPPADGDVVVYARADRKLYSMDHLGVETLMSGGLGAATNRMFEGRITPTQGVPVENAAKSAITSLWIEPYLGNQVKLFNGVGWDPYTVLSQQVKLTDVQTGNTTNGSTTIGGLSDTSHFVVGTLVSGIGIPAGASVASIVSGSSVTISAAATADGVGVSLTFKDPKDTNFDLYLVADGGSPVVRKVKWTTATTRSVAIAYQDGVKVKSGDATWLYIGFYRTWSTDGQTEWGVRHRLIINEYNKHNFSLYATVQGGHTVTSTSFVLMNGAETSRVYFLTDGLTTMLFNSKSLALNSTFSGRTYSPGIGVDSVSTNQALYIFPAYSAASANFSQAYAWRALVVETEGYHYAAGLELVSAEMLAQNSVLECWSGYWG